MRFAIGDRVLVRFPCYDYNLQIVGEEATICYISPDTGNYLLEFDNHFSSLHNGGGRTGIGRGWWVQPNDPCLCFIVGTSSEDKVLRKCRTLWNNSKWVQTHKDLAY